VPSDASIRRRNQESMAASLRQQAEVHVELAMALDHFRWCWACGARHSDCMRAALGGKACCPDCRHRDALSARVGPVR
jgi:hypothetical protein